MIKAPGVAFEYGFCPSNKEDCEQALKGLKEHIEAENINWPTGPLYGGISPHAGWCYSGPTMAATALALSRAGVPEITVLLAPIHRSLLNTPGCYTSGAWETPLGSIEIAEDLATGVNEIDADAMCEELNAHGQEWTGEAIVPFIQYFLPESKLLPILLPPNKSDALKLGEALGKAIEKLGKKTYLIASTDLTHYGKRFNFESQGPVAKAWKWVQEENDRDFLQEVADLNEDGIFFKAQINKSACGAQTVACAVRAAKILGSTKGNILHQSSSYDPDEPDAEGMVGYGSVVF